MLRLKRLSGWWPSSHNVSRFLVNVIELLETLAMLSEMLVVPLGVEIPVAFELNRCSHSEHVQLCQTIEPGTAAQMDHEQLSRRSPAFSAPRGCTPKRNSRFPTDLSQDICLLEAPKVTDNPVGRSDPSLSHQLLAS